jgi:hypothetical protein
MTAILKPATALIITCCLLLCINTTAKAQSSPEVQKQMDDLKQQIAFLKTELAALKSVISTSSNGNLSIVNGAGRTESIGGQYSQTIGSSSSISIAANQTETIGMNFSSSVAKSISISTGNNYVLSAGKEILFEAADQITIKTGSASIILKKNGDIEFKGNVILPKTNKEVLIKGSKIE